MKYDFDKIIDRSGTNALKYSVLKERYGRDDLIPLWVADLDFETPDFITDALRKRLSRWNKQQQHIFRQFVREAIEVKLDGNGRFLIPKRYLSMAEIEQDIVFIGVGNTIEIWSGKNAAEPFVDDETFSKTIEELMSDSNDNDDND